MPFVLSPGVEVQHQSRLLSYRSPQGALPCGERVTLSLDAALRFTKASLRLWVQDHEVKIPMAAQIGQQGQRFTAQACMPQEPGWVWYYFILESPGEPPVYYGGTSGWGSAYPYEPPGYQITVYRPDFQTPRWFREGILYQIFPDRFYREQEDATGIAYHAALGRRVRYHSDWDDTPEYLPEPGEKDYQPNDFFGGTLRGILQKLPYLESLGVSCIYLNPVFESPSNHRYDTGDYRRVDPVLGSNEDLQALCEQAAARGMRVMLDGVFSHTGDDSLYFNKYGRYPGVGAYQSQDSPYRSWYSFGEYPPIGYKTWWGFPKLPEVNELEPAYQDFVYGQQDSLLAYWAGYGVTSWRLDVADELPDVFIQRLRQRQKALDPQGVLLGEVWEDASTKEAYGIRRHYVHGQELDSVMNYPFRDAVVDFLLYRCDAFGLNDRLQLLRERYPKPFWYAAMNLLSTHDSVRAATMLAGAPHRDALSREEQAVFSPSPEDALLGRRKLLAATALQMALPGVPSMYYGDEAGVTGMADPFNRKTYPWGKEDQALLGGFRSLCGARKGAQALFAGFCRMGALTPDVFAVLRYTGQQDAFGEPARPSVALLLLNRGQDAAQVQFTPDLLQEGPDARIPLRLEGAFRDCLSGDEIQAQDGGLSVSVPGVTARLMIQDNNFIS